MLGLNALHFAVAEGHLDTAKELLDSGIDVNSANIDLWTPLHYAGDFAVINTEYRHSRPTMPTTLSTGYPHRSFLFHVCSAPKRRR